MTSDWTAQQVIDHLDLSPHPEGGWYRQTWQAKTADGARPVGTAIYFLLKAGESSHWHRVDAAEVWLWHAGAPLVLSRAPTDAGPAYDITLGVDLTYQAVVDPGHWQAARTTGDWSAAPSLQDFNSTGSNWRQRGSTSLGPVDPRHASSSASQYRKSIQLSCK